MTTRLFTVKLGKQHKLGALDVERHKVDDARLGVSNIIPEEFRECSLAYRNINLERGLCKFCITETFCVNATFTYIQGMWIGLVEQTRHLGAVFCANRRVNKNAVGHRLDDRLICDAWIDANKRALRIFLAYFALDSPRASNAHRYVLTRRVWIDKLDEIFHLIASRDVEHRRQIVERSQAFLKHERSFFGRRRSLAAAATREERRLTLNAGASAAH